ncbi:hypothetical protein [Fischerella thermalis]|nr:hypothetical protein [Fischerella thermalis]
MKERAEKWLKSDRAQQIINNQCISWFNNQIQPDLATGNDPICRLLPPTNNPSVSSVFIGVHRCSISQKILFVPRVST